MDDKICHSGKESNGLLEEILRLGEEIDRENAKIKAEVEESEEFKTWKQFFEGLTMEWLVENHMGTKIGTRPNDRLVYTYVDILLIVWNNISFYFDPPTWASSVNLSPLGDREMIKYVPVDVMNDFVRVIEL